MKVTTSELFQSGVSPFCVDEAEAATINNMIVGLPSFDDRSNQELESCAFTHTEPRERERAIWELAYRDVPEKGALIERCFASDDSAEVRWNLLWLALKVAAPDARKIIESALSDRDREVRDWARLYHSEMSGEPFVSEYDSAVMVCGRPFDQTLPLQIAGMAVISVLGEDRRIILSPLWFAHIQGRVLACTRRDTFMTNLTIEKAYFGFHPDGSDHYEIYPFMGKSWRGTDGRSQHRYLTGAVRPIYLSGKVEEEPTNKILVPMAAARAATVRAVAREVHDWVSDSEGRLVPADLPVRREEIISDVRGQYLGWAHASVKHFLSEGDVSPGTVQLLSPVNKETAHLVNCYICGTFRGKVGDYNRDGLLEINEIVCHGSEDGRLDYLGDGRFLKDPFE